MRRFTLPLLLFALALLLFGCTQQGIPASCANSTLDRLPNCVYVAAVMEQNPYDCYSLQNMSQREKCLRDASDSAMKKLLEQMTPDDRAKVFAAISGASGAYIPLPSPPANGQQNNPSPIISNPPANVSDADAQAYAQAVSANDMAPCATIGDPSTRSSCIAQVAIQVKNPAMCSQFTGQSDIDLCNMYSQGGS